MLMNISQLGYDLENDTITFCGQALEQGDGLEICIPSPISGAFEWVPVRLEWVRFPKEGWYFVCEAPEMKDIIATCNPVGLFARK